MKHDYSQDDLIIVDHLAFTVPMIEFRHLEFAGGEHKKQWAKFPKRTFNKIKDNAVKEHMIADYQAEYAHVCMVRFRQFCDKILNLRISENREKGLHGYTNSATILAKNAPIKLGFIGFGGNNNTIYFQLSGEGCKHLFSFIRPFNLHFWLTKVLMINKLNRIDLAYDDFEGNYSIEYAERAYADDAFKNPNGGRTPKATTICERMVNEITGHTFAVGSRQSSSYWRIYDKAMEQGAPAGTVWVRSEVELKKVNADVLLSPIKSFAGINAFSASFTFAKGVNFKSLSKKTVLDFNSRIRWAKRQCGKTISDVLESFGGDVYATLGALCDDRGGHFSLPDTQALLLNKIYSGNINHAA